MKSGRVISILILTVIAVVLIAQARLLYIFPQSDSARWWGDETGQMLELRAEVQDGYARIPTGLGSSVAITNGIVRGNSWLAAAIYGLPVHLFSGVAGIVDIGRTITFLLSITMLVVMYRMLRAFGVSQMVSLLAILLLVTTRSFFFSSHAARLDIAAGFSVLVFAWYLSTRFDFLRSGKWNATARWYFFYGVVAILFGTLSIHLVTLLAAISIYMLWRFGAFQKVWPIFVSLGGTLAMLAILFSVYAISGAPVTLFGNSVASNQFQSVAGGLPILRPFSRSVQLANILERLHGLWFEAPTFLILIVVTIAIQIIFLSKAEKSHKASFIYGAAIAIAISWLLFESPALYYFFQVIPIFIVVLFIEFNKQLQGTKVTQMASIAIAIVLCYFGVSDTMRAAHLSKAIEQDNSVAIASALDSIKAETKQGTIPIVLAQNPAIAIVEHEKNVRLMTAHLVSFPTSSKSIADVLKDVGVSYMILYAPHDRLSYSLDYHVLRPIADSIGTIVLRKTGTMFDVHRDYFSEQTDDRQFALNQDTMILYRLSIAR